MTCTVETVPKKNVKQGDPQMTSMKDKYIAQQRARLSAGFVSRRQFMTSMVAAGVAVPTALGWADKVMAATPNKGGTLILGRGFGSTTDSLDSGTYENSFMTSTGFMYGNALTEVAPDGSLVGDLASDWEASADAMTWRFNLRQGVEFHNGKTLTPDDVIASLDYHGNENSKSAAKGLLSSVQSMTADGNSVVFQLSEGNADFPYIMSDYHLLILPSSDGTIDPNSGIGTGPYVLENFEPGVRVTATRNPNYYKSDRAHFDSVEMLSIIDVTARQNALMNGSVHAIDRVDPKTAGLLGRAPGMRLLEKTGYLHYTFPMRVDAAPFDNYDLRMALKYSVKRQELIDKILLGHGAMGNDHPISTAVPFHADSLEQREFDADKAKFHYQKSGHSGTIQLSASDAAFAGAVDAAQLIAASAAEVGINIEVVREPADGYWSNVWNKKPWCACYWGGRPTQDWMYSSAYVNTTEWNDTAWKTGEAADRFNAVVTEARAEIDAAKREALYFEAQSLINDDGGALVPMFANYIMGISNKIAHDDNVAANWVMDGEKATERWWMA